MLLDSSQRPLSSWQMENPSSPLSNLNPDQYAWLIFEAFQISVKLERENLLFLPKSWVLWHLRGVAVDCFCNTFPLLKNQKKKLYRLVMMAIALTGPKSFCHTLIYCSIIRSMNTERYEKNSGPRPLMGPKPAPAIWLERWSWRSQSLRYVEQKIWHVTLGMVVDVRCWFSNCLWLSSNPS